MRVAASGCKAQEENDESKKKKNTKTHQAEYHNRSATDKTDITLKIYLLLVNVLYDHN